MPLEIHPVTTTDIPEITEVQGDAFSTDFDRAMFPDTAEMKQWFFENFEGKVQKAASEESTDMFIKVVDTDTALTEGQERKPRIAGIAYWRGASVTPETVAAFESELSEKDLDFWPECSNRELCRQFFGEMTANQLKYMNGKPHMCLDLLAVSPAYQGKGCASRLLKYGLSRVDERGLEAYLSASPRGRPVYEKYGFQVVGTDEYPGFVQTCMLRPARK